MGYSMTILCVRLPEFIMSNLAHCITSEVLQVSVSGSVLILCTQMQSLSYEA